MLKALSALTRSRKIMLLAFGVVQTIVLHYMNIDPEVWAAIDALVVACITSIAYEDGKAKSAADTKGDTQNVSISRG